MLILRSQQTYRISNSGGEAHQSGSQPPLLIYADVQASLKTTVLCHKLLIKFNTEFDFQNFFFDSIKIGLVLAFL